MRVDAKNSMFQEDSQAVEVFNRRELRNCRYLLRRLRFLEAKMQREDMADPSNDGGAVFADLEVNALEWLLTEIGFLAERSK